MLTYSSDACALFGTSPTTLRIDLTYTATGKIASELRYKDLAGQNLIGSTGFS